MSDIIKILLQAEVGKESIQGIKSQLEQIQTDIKPMKLEVGTKGIAGVKDMTSAFEKLEQVTKKNLTLDLERISSRYRNLIKPDDIANIKSMINSLSHTDPKLGHNIDLIKVKMKEVSIGAEQSKKSLDLANKSAMSFGDAMKTAAYKFGIQMPPSTVMC